MPSTRWTYTEFAACVNVITPALEIRKKQNAVVLGVRVLPLLLEA